MNHVERAAAVCRRTAGARDLLPLAAAHPGRYPALLESAAPGLSARWDILFAFPEDRLVLSSQDGAVRDGSGRDCGARFLDALDRAWSSRRGNDRIDSTLPFIGGWLLYLGYELAREVEPSLVLPDAQATSVPVALGLRCPAAILVDRVDACTWLVAEPGRETLLDAMRRDLENAAPNFDAPLPPLRACREDDPQQFLDGVARVHAYLRAGDTFQINLSRAWRAQFDGAPAPAALHAALRRANPAPFAALLQQTGWSIASSSPERLLQTRDGIAQTRPIAGTRPRVAGEDDAARVAELLGHAKERAEHVMLVDLERNDLGRVCVPGSVCVDEMMVVESFAHVHHIVSNVRGRLRPEVTPGQAIAALFPGGTITGCPKVRCMQIIAELEGVARGAYTGSLGYLSRNGNLDLNILIRTMVLEGDRLAFRAGAGIVVNSDAERELEETRAKARGLLRALGRDAA